MITINFTKLDIKPGFKTLDVGCGSGRHLANIAGYKNVTAIGMDLNLNDLKEAKKRIEFHKKAGVYKAKKTYVISADISNLPFCDNYFDIVICSEVLEHIIDHKKAINELNRVLKTKSILAVSVPRYFPELVCWKLSDDYHNFNQGHVRIYKKKQLIELICNKGFRFLSFHYAHSLHSPYWWLKCLFHNADNKNNDEIDNFLISMYHKFLVWDIMKKPLITKVLDYLLNPFLGKSLVLYFRKN